MASDDTPRGTVATTPAPVTGSLEDIEDSILDSILGDPEGQPDEDDDKAPAEGDAGDDQDDPDNADDDEQPDDDEDGGQPRDAKGRFIPDDAKIRMPDGTVATVKDLKEGHLRQADYTRKTQEVAEARRTYQERNQRVEQLETQLSKTIEWAGQVLQYRTPKAPDRSMIQSDPIGYQEQLADYQEHMAYLNSFGQQFSESQRRQQELIAEQRAEQARSGREYLLAQVPELRDEAKFKAFADDILKHGTEAYEFSREELGSVTDPRMLRALHDAIKWRNLQAQRAKAQDKTKGRPPVSPDRRQSPESNQTRNREKDFKVLRATGGKGQAGDAALDRLLDKFI